MMPEFGTFGAALRYFRTRRQLTQNELARAIGYSREQVNHLESGRRKPDPIAVAALFVPALHLEREPTLAARLVSLAEVATPEPNMVVAIDAIAPAEPISDGLQTTNADEAERAYHREQAEIAQLVQGDMLSASRHYMLAGDLIRAVDVLANQGTALLGQEKAQPATALMDELLPLLRANIQQSGGKDLLRRLLVARGDILINTLRTEEAKANYEEALTLTSGAVKADISYRLATALIQRSQPHQALELVRIALQDIDPTYVVLRANLRMAEGGALLALGQTAEAEAPTLEAFDLAESLLLSMPMIANGLRARAGNSLGVIYAHRQQLAMAIEYWEAACNSAVLTPLRPLATRFRGNIANALFELGRLEEAEAVCNEVITGLLAINDAVGASKFMHLRAALLYSFGHLADALQQIDDTCAIKTTLGDQASSLLSTLLRLKILMALGRMAEVEVFLNEGLAQAQTLEDSRLLIGWLLLACEWDLLRQRTAAAVVNARIALDLATAGQFSKEVQDAQTHLGVALVLNGDTDTALSLLHFTDDSVLRSEVQLERALAYSVVLFTINHDHQKAHKLLLTVRTQATEVHHLACARRAEHALQLASTLNHAGIATVLFGALPE